MTNKRDTDLLLHEGKLRGSVASSGELRFSIGGTELPWRVDLGMESAWITVREGCTDKRHPVRLEALEARQLSPSRIQWLGEIAGAGVALDLQLKNGALRCSVAPLCTGPNTLIAACWPGNVAGCGKARELVWGGDGGWGQGRLFRSDGREWKHSTRWDSNAMRLAGITCDRASLAMILETPYDAESEMTDDGVQRMVHRVAQNSSLGELRYPRVLTLVPMGEPGYVAMADLFREYARQNGMWVSWEERVAENPALEAMPGAFFGFAGYLHDDGADIPGALRKMKAYGFERGFVYSPKLRTFDDANWSRHLGRFNSMTDAQIREIQSLGYICAPFLQVELSSEGMGKQLMACDQDGEPIKRWQIGEVNYYEIVKWRIPGMMIKLDSELTEVKAVHFDTLAASPLVEHFGQCSYGRSGDVSGRCELARHHRRQGKIIMSEGLKDWSNTVCDMGSSHPFAPRLGPRTGVTYGSDRVWNVPLMDLVYHDSCIRSCWEHHYYNDAHAMVDYDLSTWHPFAMPLMDTLTASPPVLFPEGKMYCYQLDDTINEDGWVTRTTRWDKPILYSNRFDDPALQAVLPEALRICRLNMRHGTARMLSHRYLEPGSALVQETTFSTGLRVVANFSDEPFTTADGRTVASRTALTEE